MAKKCACGMPLDKDTSCSCDSKTCVHCCTCGETCECNCQEKKAKK
ncbi:MAG: hypothetical protein V1916_03550 [Patescibacteria group bacterium]